MHSYGFMRHRLSRVETVVRFQFEERFGWRKSSRRYGVIPSKLWGGRAVPPSDNIRHHSTAGPPFSTTTLLKRWVEEVERKAKNNPGLCLYSSSLFLVLSLANAHQLLSVVILWSRPYHISVLKSVTQEKHLVAAVLKDRAWNHWTSQTTDQWKVTLAFIGLEPCPTASFKLTMYLWEF